MRKRKRKSKLKKDLKTILHARSSTTGLITEIYGPFKVSGREYPPPEVRETIEPPNELLIRLLEPRGDYIATRIRLDCSDIYEGGGESDCLVLPDVPREYVGQIVQIDLDKRVLENPKFRRYIMIRNGIETLYNRGGLVDIPGDKRRKLKHCIQEMHNVNVDVLGNVVLCCCDYLGSVNFGNVLKTNIIDIWFSDEYKKIRKELRKGIFSKDICQNCTN